MADALRAVLGKYETRDGGEDRGNGNAVEAQLRDARKYYKSIK
jgi:hypothetical protein